MKKTIIALAAVLVLGGTASAQYFYYNGERTINLGVGTAIPMSPLMAGDEYTTILSETPHPFPLSAMLNSGHEFAIDENFSWGYQYELNWIRYGADYEKTEFSEYHTGSFDRWDLRLDVRVTFGYYITDNLEVLLGIGGGHTLLSGKSESIDNGARRNNVDLSNGYIAAHALLGVNYRFNDIILAFCNLRGDIFSYNYFSAFGGGSYSYRLVPMVGVGFLL